jgi:ParB family chromosome partitioning protein
VPVSSKSNPKKGLGRGFEALIPTDLLDESFDPTASQDEQISELRQIKISEIITDPDQPRRSFDEASLIELASSITQHGVVQPIIVVPHEAGYQIVAGERRYRAAVIAKLDKIPALVRTLNNQHKLEISLIENLQRKDINIIETATAYLKLRTQFNLSFEEIGQQVGKSVSTINNTTRLLRLPAKVRQALAEGKVSEGQIRPFVGLDDGLVESILSRIIREHWNSRDSEEYVVHLRKANVTDLEESRRTVIRSPYEPDIKRLTKRYAADVSVHTNSRGAGRIIIKFTSDKEFRRIQELLEK